MSKKVKDSSKEKTVKAYQNQVSSAIENIKSRDGKLRPTTKDYIKTLEENLKRAPYVIGWLHWPETKNKR